MQHVTGLVRDRTKTEILLTAAEAFPAFERAVLAAESEIWASFRIFDLRTRLRSSEARAIGSTWFDLVADALRRGVSINLIISDFDPVARPSLHRGTWAAVRQVLAAGEASGAPERLRVCAAMHPAVTGRLPRAVLWPQVAVSLARTARWLNARDPVRRISALRDMPGLAGLLRIGPDGRVRARPWRLPVLHPATHHQKLAVFDRQKLYIGGLDLDERRWDTPDHDRPGAETWQDLQLMVEGPVVREAQTHLESFLDVTAGRAPPPPQRRLLRTLSRTRGRPWLGFGPEPVTQEILEAHEMLASRAESLIYLETQFFRDTRLARCLARAGRMRPKLSLILILPAAPEEVAFGRAWGIDTRYGEHLQAKCLRILERAFGPRLFVGGAAQPRRHPRPSHDGPDAAGPEGKDGPEVFSGADEPAEPMAAERRGHVLGAPLVYIHAKISIFDDTAAIVSSANLNGRSLRWDTEAGVLLRNPQDARRLRERVMRHWLPADPDPRYLDPAQAATMWRLLALRNARRPPEHREGFVVPYDLKAAERLGQAVPGVPEEMV
ncbi:phospholipase D-like domain-containing protein [Rubellimicrobium arenae]|uniref:phospholipase D-like domain-containing protein n=1 Tax=Rubellimicrobium arenae TaxID=2817372 RepID=UPI001B30AA1E|nr:phospholipase D-like domain-containing protein [Rubellimicrobium arenae]